MTTRLADLAASLRRRCAFERRLFLDFEEIRVEFETNSAALRDGLADYFGPFVAGACRTEIRVAACEGPPPDLPLSFAVKEPEPGKKKIKEEFCDLPDGRVVRKRLTGMVFLFGGKENLAAGPCLANPNQVVNFINNRYIEWKLRRGALLGHAAAVRGGGRGLALAGMSGAGKSTLALHVLSLGADFVSNDRVMLERRDAGVCMRGVAKLPRINPGTALHNPDLVRILDEEDRRRYAALPPEELWEVERKYDASVETCFGPGRFVLGAPLDGLVILNWRLGDPAPPELVRTDLARRRDLLTAFVKSPGLFYLPAPGSPGAERPEEDYLELLSGCEVVELRGGVDFEKAADACLNFLETGRFTLA